MNIILEKLLLRNRDHPTMIAAEWVFGLSLWVWWTRMWVLVWVQCPPAVYSYHSNVSIPQNLTVASYNDSNLTLAWLPSPHSEMWYQLWFWPRDVDLELAMVTTADVNYTFTGLVPGQLYSFWLVGIVGNQTSDYTTLQQRTCRHWAQANKLI